MSVTLCASCYYRAENMEAVLCIKVVLSERKAVASLRLSEQLFDSVVYPWLE